jgi:predicted RNA-binding protein (TIGR00451 family)
MAVPALDTPGDRRKVSIMVDYLFGRGVSRALPRSGFRLYYSRRSGRVKLVHLDGKVFATVKPNGAMALSMYGATVLSRSPSFKEDCVQVSDDAAPFVKGGRSVFCKFVTRAGRNIQPKSEVAVVDGRGRVLGVGMAVLNGSVMAQFKHGVAVKVRAGLPG